jgi:hypothetical protein
MMSDQRAATSLAACFMIAAGACDVPPDGEPFEANIDDLGAEVTEVSSELAEPVMVRYTMEDGRQYCLTVDRESIEDLVPCNARKASQRWIFAANGRITSPNGVWCLNSNETGPVPVRSPFESKVNVERCGQSAENRREQFGWTYQRRQRLLRDRNGNIVCQRYGSFLRQIVLTTFPAGSFGGESPPASCRFDLVK